MNSKNLSIFNFTFTQQHFHFCVFTLLFILSQKSHCADDPFYAACAQINNCGQHNITYPFYIWGQNSSCGFPGFELNCTNDGLPILHLDRNNYIVDRIYHNNRSVRLYNAAVSSAGIGCLPENISNVSLVGDDRFRFVNHSELVLLANCSTNVRQEFLRYRVGCGGWDLAMLDDDEELGVATEGCEVKVAAPVEVHDGDGVGEYVELMRRGFLLNWMAADCSECERSGGRCGFNYASYQFRCFCTDRPHRTICVSRTHSGMLSRVLIVTGAIGAAIGFSIIVGFLGRKIFMKWRKKTNLHHNIENFLTNHDYLAPKIYSYPDIKKMTNSFKDKLGEGGYGFVYKGKLKNGNLVAVKVLKESKGEGEEFFNEVASISRTSHVNVVTLLGFCLNGKKRALIYEFMPNGSLEKFTYDGISSTNHQLGWDRYYKIAIGIARGLEYLHRGCNTRILHFDIKPHNILLDEDFVPKISDFGLAKLCHGKESAISMTNARGTIGYIAPEVFCRNFGRVSHKSDVYSYGMMILEMVGGKKNIKVELDDTSEIYFPDWIYKKLESDKELGLYGIMNEDENVYARKMIIVSLWCIQSNPSTRPSMSRVVEMLEGSLDSIEIPPKPVMSSPPSSPTTHYS